jgi:hypothetical protein
MTSVTVPPGSSLQMRWKGRPVMSFVVASSPKSRSSESRTSWRDRTPRTAGTRLPVGEMRHTVFASE